MPNANQLLCLSLAMFRYDISRQIYDLNPSTQNWFDMDDAVQGVLVAAFDCGIHGRFSRVYAESSALLASVVARYASRAA